MNLPKELTARIANHLSNVRKNLGGLPPDEQKEILQSIESRIYDALKNRGGVEPTSARLDAVLAEMDPPESYGDSMPVPDQKKNRHWRTIIPLLILIAMIAVGIKFSPKKQKDDIMKHPLTLTVASILAATNLIAGEARSEFHLQGAIDDASPGDTITIPPGIYTQPIVIRKKITLEGQDTVLKITANQPAIQIDTSKPVFLKKLEIQYQSKSKP